MRNFPIFDAHYDILQTEYDNDENIVTDSYYAVNLNEMMEHTPIIRGLASFVRPTYAENGFKRANESLDRFYEDYRNNPAGIKIIKKSEDFNDVIQNDLLGILLTIENGTAIQGNLNNISYFYERGVRMMGITWNQDNDLGCGVATQHDTGLTDLGKDYIRELNRQKIAIDVSHASPKTIDDVLKISKSPIIASHSCSRTLCNHRRNLTDDQIIKIAQKGGMIGVTCYNQFLKYQGSFDSSDVFDHIDHIANLVGINKVGLGSDFQIFEESSMPSNVKNLSDFNNLFEEMRNNDYEEDEIAMVAGGNFIEVLSRIMEKEKDKNIIKSNKGEQIR